jgi:acyl-CoA dehydrogenase
MIDFDVEPEFQKQIDWVENFTKEEIEPLDNFLSVGRSKDGERIDREGWQAIRGYIEDLKEQVRDQGLWGFHLGPDLGGPGLGQVKLCLLNEKLGRTRMGPTIFGCQAPDTGNMELIAHNGTEEQKEKYLKPLLSGEKHSAYSMTEPHAGEPGEFVCSAKRDGDEWVINGEKWFTSNGADADFLIVMAVTAPDKPLLERASMFIVDRDTPGVEIVRNVHGLGTPLKENYKLSGGGHAYIRYDNVRIPRQALLGEEGAGFVGSQTRLSGGRVHHAMRAVGVCTKALDMMCERALSRKAKGELLSNLQMVQQDIADSYIQLKQFRLHVLYTAWLIDKTKAYTREVRKEIASIKISAAKVNHDIIYRAIHLHGALGMSNETPLGEMWMAAPQMGIMDGTTEVHKSNLAKLLLRDYEACEDLFPTYHLPKLIAQAQDKFEKVIASHVAA